LINRDQHHELAVDATLADRQFARVLGVDAMGGGDVKAANSWDAPNRVALMRGVAELTELGELRVRVPAPGLAVVRVALAE
jgi:alpha-L-arabinofuranosidase